MRIDCCRRLQETKKYVNDDETKMLYFLDICSNCGTSILEVVKPNNHFRKSGKDARELFLKILSSENFKILEFKEHHSFVQGGLCSDVAKSKR